MNSTRPDDREIIALHKKFAQSDEAFNLVYTHCQIVWRIAEQLIRKNDLRVDEELVRVGCLLYDIGVYQFNDSGTSYLQHGLVGEELLKSEGITEEVYRFASHHIGLGLTKDYIVRTHLPLPPMDLSPVTVEERIVLYADKFHSAIEPPQFNSFQAYKKFVVDTLQGPDDYYVQKFEQLVQEFGEPDLQELSEEYGHILV